MASQLHDHDKSFYIGIYYGTIQIAGIIGQFGASFLLLEID
jgi:hypothetical protein